MTSPSASPLRSSPNKRTRDNRGNDESQEPSHSAKKMALQTTSKLETAPPVKQRDPKGRASLLLKDNIPFDIQAEVFSYIPPNELLRLTRASKHLRAILMSKSARAIWVTSFLTLPQYSGLRLPSCPPDLSEPQYASLLFDTACLHCGNDEDQTSDFGSRERLCHKCQRRKQNRISRRSTLENFARVCGISGEPPEDFATIFGLVPRSQLSGLFCPEVALGVYRQCKVREAQLGPAEYDVYLHQRGEDMDAIRMHGQEVGAWHKAYRLHREPSAKTKRYNQIAAKLSQLGWSTSDFLTTDSPDYPLWKKLISSNKPLTDQKWASIGPQFEQMLSTEKARRTGPKVTHTLVNGQWITS